MKVLMVPTYFGGISHWRFEVPAKALKDAGHDVTCLNSDQMLAAMKEMGTFERWLDREMPKYDVVHVGYSPTLDIAKALFVVRDRHKVPVITDIDDDIDNVPPYNSGWAAFRPGSPGQRIAKTQLQHSDGVTFSTQPLADALAYLVKDKPSRVLGNWLDVTAWDWPTPSERQEDQSVRVLITGGHGRFGDWAILKEPLEWAMAHYDGLDGKPMLRLFWLGATPDWVLPWMSSPSDPLANRCFYIQPTQDTGLFNKLVRYVAPDIILSAVQTNVFNRAKSGLKWLEATVAGAAFLCTDWPTYDIAPKGTCLKVDNTPTQWRESLTALIEDSHMRKQLVDNARDRVFASCLAPMYIDERVDFYMEVCRADSRKHLDGRDNHLAQPAS